MRSSDLEVPELVFLSIYILPIAKGSGLRQREYLTAKLLQRGITKGRQSAPQLEELGRGVQDAATRGVGWYRYGAKI